MSIGLILNFTLLDKTVPMLAPTVSERVEESVLSEDISDNPPILPAAAATPAPDLSGKRVLLMRATSVLSAIKSKDYITLSTYVHPQKGVTFTLFHGGAEANFEFSVSGIARAGEDPLQYIWGITDGRGSPIQLTMADYFAVYVFNAEFIRRRLSSA